MLLIELDRDILTCKHVAKFETAGPHTFDAIVLTTNDGYLAILPSIHPSIHPPRPFLSITPVYRLGIIFKDFTRFCVYHEGSKPG